jgi:hypothetical protein
LNGATRLYSGGHPTVLDLSEGAIAGEAQAGNAALGPTRTEAARAVHRASATPYRPHPPYKGAPSPSLRARKVT